MVKELPVEKSVEEDIPYFNLEPIGALDKIPIQENYDPMVDIREFCPEVDVAESVRYPFLRRRVAEMLNQAQSYLPPGYKLSISGGYSCYRPLEQQAKAYWRFYKRAKEEHPNWPESAVRRQINRGIHPPDAKTPPGHSTGAAIDIGIIDPEGNPLDMRSLAKGVKPEQARRTSDTLSNKVSPEARANRLMLLRAMAKAGFSNCTAEFWHYSYGDSGWAVRVGEKIAYYGPADKLGDPKFEAMVRQADEEHAKREAEENATRLNAILAQPYPPATREELIAQIKAGDAAAAIENQIDAQKQAFGDALRSKDLEAVKQLSEDSRLPKQIRMNLSRMTQEALDDQQSIERILRWNGEMMDDQKAALAKLASELPLPPK